MMDEFTKGWFNCLNSVAMEIEIDHDYRAQGKLLDIMESAGITLEEVREAQEMEFTALNRSMILVEYEGIMMEREENEEE